MEDSNSNNNDSNNGSNPFIVQLCGNGCCPTADFSKKGKVTVSDEGQSVTFTKSQIVEFVKQLSQRGFLDYLIR